jgi:predicted  nucleic acid-binding Zn-ribbon protein
MNFKYIAGIPVIISILVAIYSGINYASKLTNIIDDNEQQITMLKKDVSANSKNYTEAREELFREITQITTWIGRIEATTKAMEKIMYETASESELQALNDSYYKLNDSIRQLEYDLKYKQEVLELSYKIKGIKLQIDPEYRTLCQKDMSNIVCQ